MSNSYKMDQLLSDKWVKHDSERNVKGRQQEHVVKDNHEKEQNRSRGI